ncbi:MAG: SH3 domain-containing protein, partial [Pseudomonadota bacterium]
VYKRRNLPVKIIAEFDVWRKIIDHEQSEGWIHRSMLSAKSFALVTEKTTLRRNPNEHESAIAHLGAGLVVQLKQCDLAWCHVSMGDYQGWLTQQALWGVANADAQDDVPK